MLGEPVSSTLMVRWDDQQSVQMMAGWSFGQERMHLGVDYLYSPTEIDSDDAMGLHYPVYFGVGVRLRLLGESSALERERPRGVFGFRFPFGVSVEPEDLPLEVYFEMAPVWMVTPVSHSGFDGGIGVRIFL
jgi:hypothetical protein